MIEGVPEGRTLVMAPRGRDAHTICGVLHCNRIDCIVCEDLSDLLRQLEVGAGTALITEEALSGNDLTPLLAWLTRQPPWSDFPFILLVSHAAGPDAPASLALLETLSNVILLERPLNAETLRRATTSALRARKRQYQTRAVLRELRHSQNALRQLNDTLESRIGQRTAELAQVNDRLMHEINERERTQVALVQAQKMEAIGRLTGGIAHDFNNLLHVIVGNVDLIDRITDDTRVKRFAGIAKKSAQRGTRLTGQLLAFARNQSLLLKAVDLPELIEGMKDLLRVSLGSRIAIELQLQPGLGPAMADTNQIEMAILNLAINARDAMPDGGIVTIRNSVHAAAPGTDLEPGNYAVVSLADTGCGIRPDLLTKVFDPFFTTKPVGQGTGLGLSQVYGIAQQSGGTARIFSTRGQGTTVEIWLPLAAPDQLVQRHSEEVSEWSGENATIRILVVEDDKEVREYMVESLGLLGYQVNLAVDGPAGLREIERECPDLLIVDFLMPGMNGAEVVASVNASVPNLPIIVATGYADMQAIDNVIGNESILRKPFQINELARTVRSALAKST